MVSLSTPANCFGQSWSIGYCFLSVFLFIIHFSFLLGFIIILVSEQEGIAPLCHYLPSVTVIAFGNHIVLDTLYIFLQFSHAFVSCLCLSFSPCLYSSFLFVSFCLSFLLLQGMNRRHTPRVSSTVHCSFYKVRHGGRDVNWYQVLSGVDDIRPRITSPDLFESSTGTLVPQNDWVQSKQKSNCIAPLCLFCLRQCQTVMMTTLYRV